MSSLLVQAGTSKDLLLHLYNDQRAELGYRRMREHQIFTWSASLLIGITGTFLIVDPNQELVLSSLHGRTITTLVVVALTGFSLLWQINQWNRASLHQQILARLAEELGAFREVSSTDGEPWYPAEWKQWGGNAPEVRYRINHPTKVLATALLGLLAGLAIWVPLAV